MLYVRYEDFCSQPQATMNTIYKYIQEEPFTHDFNNLKKEVYEDDSHFGVYGSHKVAEKLSVVPKDYNDILGKDVATKIRNDYPWFFDTFGY